MLDACDDYVVAVAVAALFNANAPESLRLCARARVVVFECAMRRDSAQAHSAHFLLARTCTLDATTRESLANQRR